MKHLLTFAQFTTSQTPPFTHLAEKLELPKNTWQPLTQSELDDLKREIFDLVSNAYQPIGGHPNLKSPSDIPGDLGDLFTVIDLDDDPDPDAVVINKKRPMGHKFVAMGHDGSKAAKSSAINYQVDRLKKKGYYIEVSGSMLDILTAKGVPIIDNEAYVRKVLKGKEITWNGDGTYTREIGNQIKTKVLMGKPKL